MKQHWFKFCTKIRQNIAKPAKKSTTLQTNQKIAKFGGKSSTSGNTAVI